MQSRPIPGSRNPGLCQLSLCSWSIKRCFNKDPDPGRQDRPVDIDADEPASGDQAFQFIGQSEFTGAGQLRFHQYDGHTFIEANTINATPGAELVIVLDPLTSLQAGDFVL